VTILVKDVDIVNGVQLVLIPFTETLAALNDAESPVKLIFSPFAMANCSGASIILLLSLLAGTALGVLCASITSPDFTFWIISYAET